MAKRLTCGVVVTDGTKILLGHAARSPRWDIPKGVAEPGEAPVAAALRELAEETGLVAPAGALAPLGQYRYLPAKDLALFVWATPALPDPTRLVCRSMVPVGNGFLPEFDRFALFAWDEALERTGKNMARVLIEVRPRLEGAAARG